MWFAKPYRNAAGLLPEKLKELLAGFEKLKDFGGDLYDRVVRYVLDGDDEPVLAELASKTDAAEALRLLCASKYGLGGDKDPWGEFLKTIEAIDCRFYLRLGKVFEAAAEKLPADRFFCQDVFDNNLWLEILLRESARTAARGWSSLESAAAISAVLIEGMLKADGRSVDIFIVSAFNEAGKKWPTNIARETILGVKYLGQMYAAHRELVAPFLRQGNAASREIAVENLARSGARAKVFIEELVECATDSAKLLREAAEALVRTEPRAARPLLEKAASDAKAAKREQAVRLLGRICGGEARAFLEKLQATERSAAVQEAIANSLRELQNEATVPPPVIEPPPGEPIPLHPPVTPALRDCMEKLFAAYNVYAPEHNQRLATATPTQHIDPYYPLSSVGADDIERTCRLLEEGGAVQDVLSKSLVYLRSVLASSKDAFRTLLEHPDFQLIHLVRFLAMIQGIRIPHARCSGIDWRATTYIEIYRRSHTPKITLVQLAEAIRGIGLPDEILRAHVLGSFVPVFRWEPEAVWPLFSNKVDVLERAFEPAADDFLSSWHRKYEFDNALRLLAMFPQVPPALVGKLWDMAIGTSKADRLRAQKVVNKLPDLPERLTQALAARSFQTRAIVAEWIGRLGDRRYVAALHAAVKTEKHDVALDEILTALERLGEAIEPYLDRDKLQAEAQKGLKKGTPPALEWFPWAHLPKVHWQESGDEVPAETVTWLVVQNFKLKSPEAGPLLRRYCAMMRPVERVELGRFVLRAWLDQDLKRKYTDTEARARAKQQAPQTWQTYQQATQWYVKNGRTPPAPYQQTLQQVEDVLFQNLQRECGSAVAEKGILAVAGACCDVAAVGPVQKYLKDWYGYRAAQCKALIAMLASIDHPSAIQYLLSIANRFRTKGIREEAEKYVNILAERKGWSLDELADRTLPTAGLGDDGALELSFGPRQFHVRVNAGMEAVLSDSDGKVLKALPAPRKDDDEELAKAAKKAFSAAKAELKKFTGLQTTRLYEAMCTQRTWPLADWQTYLLGHPLMKFLCQRLVWSVGDGDRVQEKQAQDTRAGSLGQETSELPSGLEVAWKTFRPLDDGTFTDYEDNEVQLPAHARLRIAHSCQVPAAAAAAWVRHLADYDVTPLFTQFGRAMYVLPDEKRRETSIKDFEGHMVEAFKLRGLATKFGYTRGQAQDGGWFFDYSKTFPGLGLKVQLNFSGNGLPEENRTVALSNIAFQQAGPEEASPMQLSEGMPLDEVPAVLLSECYNDLRTIAAGGSGYDPAWEKKVY